MRSKDPDMLSLIEDYVNNFCEDNGYGPSVRDIASHCNFGRSATFNYLNALVEEGRLEKAEDNTFVSTILNDEDRTYPCMVLGSVPCGPLTNVEQCVEGYIRLPETITGGRGKYYILRANGKSMIDAGIEDGDLVLIRKQDTADIDDIIVALVDNEVTLKRLQYSEKKRRYYLHPENKDFKDIYVDSLRVQGVAIRVLKNLK